MYNCTAGIIITPEFSCVSGEAIAVPMFIIMVMWIIHCLTRQQSRVVLFHPDDAEDAKVVTKD
tara:strand:+ start:1198 stop:1386 length:189 start_codon:yes stop_codon:yes gene_type:complete